MKQRIIYLWQHNRVALLAFCTVLVFAVYFASKTISSTIYWMDPKHQDQPIAGWMTPRYVANSYKIPPFVLADALLRDKAEPPRRESLAAIADAKGISLADLQDRIDAATAKWRADPNPDNWK